MMYHVLFVENKLLVQVGLVKVLQSPLQHWTKVMKILCGCQAIYHNLMKVPEYDIA